MDVNERLQATTGMNDWSDITRASNAEILAWAEAQPWVREMAACRQDAQWHIKSSDACCNLVSAAAVGTAR